MFEYEVTQNTKAGRSDVNQGCGIGDFSIDPKPSKYRTSITDTNTDTFLKSYYHGITR